LFSIFTDFTRALLNVAGAHHPRPELNADSLIVYNG